MIRASRRTLARLAALAIVAAAIVGAAQLRSSAQAPPAAAAVHDPSGELYALEFKFLGGNSCVSTTTGCHSDKEKVNTPTEFKGNSWTLWNGEPNKPTDPHRNAIKSLLPATPLGPQIAKKMGLTKPPTAEAACLACHTINPPAALRGENFKLTESVTCTACHGPGGAHVKPTPAVAAEGWNKLHQTRGWFAAQRATPHPELVKKFGLYDTQPLMPRSQQCVSCHLSIDANMVAAGHPQPTFEMYWFTQHYTNRHWDDPTTDQFPARLWAVGQAASVEAAMKQLQERASKGAAAAELTGAYLQAMGHYTVFAASIKGGMAGDLAPIAAQMTAAAGMLNDPAKNADLAKAAEAAAAAANKAGPAAEAWKPSIDQVKTTAAALIASTDDAMKLKDFGIDQHRRALFALASAMGGDNAAFVKATLFPIIKPNPKSVHGVPEMFPAAEYKAAVEKVKAKLGV